MIENILIVIGMILVPVLIGLVIRFSYRPPKNEILPPVSLEALKKYKD